MKTFKMVHVDVDQLEAVDDVEALDQSWAAVSCHLGIFHDPVKAPDGDDPEPGYPSPTWQAVLAQHSPDITVTVVSLADILAGCLSDSEKCYTALCVPGGFAPNYSSRLGARGIAIIRDFVSRGGGFVGICAGAVRHTPGALYSRIYTAVHNISVITVKTFPRTRRSRSRNRRTRPHT